MTQHTARKRFGQNFLVDTATIDAIIRAIAPRSVDTVIEIGPGLSALTAPLTDYVQPLTVIEIDNDLVRRLQHQYPAEKLHIIHQDVLTVDFNQWNKKVRVVGNLPYNISSPLLFHLLEYRNCIVDQHFMLQKEVVDRMVALPDSKAYSRISVQLQAYYYIEQLFDVPPTAFNPPPKVTSSIVRMVPLPVEQQLVKYPKAFAQVVTQAFMQRRKMLRKGLGDWATAIHWSAMPFEPTDRAEVLSVQAFNTLTTHLVEDCRILPSV